MTTDLDEVRRLRQQHGANLAFVVDHSGGKDSRAEESNARSRLSPLSLNAALTVRTRTVYNWLPIFNQTLGDVLAWHWVNAIRLHPVYVPEYHKDGTTGGYLRRFSCRVCIFSTDADLRAIRQHDREAFDLVSSLEAKMGFTMHPGASLVQIAGAAGLDAR